MLAPDQTPTDHEYFLSALEKRYKNYQMFSTGFRSEFDFSWIDLGEPRYDQVNTHATRLHTFNDTFWSVPNQGVRFGENDENDAYTYSRADEQEQVVWLRDGVYTIFDTAAPDIYISILWYEAFLDKLFRKANISAYETRNGTTYASCIATGYPNVYFMLDSHWMQIAPAEYLVDTSAAQDGKECRLKFRPIDAPFNVMGMPAYLNFYVIHNWSEG